MLVSSSLTFSKISLYKPFSSSSDRAHQPKLVASFSSTTTETRRARQSCTNKNNQMAAAASSSSLYEVLEISMGATGHEIKAAYRRLARVYHPDVVSMNQKKMSENEFIKIHTAYSTLSDPEKRASYDRNLYRLKRPVVSSSSLSSAAMASMSRFSGRTCRNWETDQCW